MQSLGFGSKSSTPTLGGNGHFTSDLVFERFLGWLEAVDAATIIRTRTNTAGANSIGLIQKFSFLVIYKHEFCTRLMKINHLPVCSVFLIFFVCILLLARSIQVHNSTFFT